MPAEPALALRSLVAGYLPGITILNGMSADVVPGQVRVVLGPNGTGKSTMLKVAFGLLPPISGDISAAGRSLAGTPPHRMAEAGIVYLPQKPSIFPFLTVEANLRVGTWTFRRDRAQVRAKIARAFDQFAILHERRRQLAGTLSGGQQRQLEIARALMTDPAVLLIDEPTASVEPRVSAQIYALIRRLADEDGKAILLVDQNIGGALGIADHVYVMRTGALFEEGPRADFHSDVSTLVSRWLYT